VSGPINFVTIGGATDVSGLSKAVVTPSGTEGAAIVRASLPGVAAGDFSLTVGPPEWDVTLRGVFISAQNGSRSPAVDTIPAGKTMKWTLVFDYDYHRLVSVGTPSFSGGEFTNANPSTVSVEFTTPGTYHYADFYQPVHTGIIVVQ
jgi:plastocyanin